LIVVLICIFFSSAFDPFDCHVSPPRIASITNQIELGLKEVDCCIYLTQSPSHLVSKSTSSPTIITRACASAKAVFLALQSNRQSQQLKVGGWEVSQVRVL
jgi:hypothetical protein